MSSIRVVSRFAAQDILTATEHRDGCFVFCRIPPSIPVHLSSTSTSFLFDPRTFQPWSKNCTLVGAMSSWSVHPRVIQRHRGSQSSIGTSGRRSSR